MTKVKLTESREGGFGGHTHWEKVVELKKDEKVPEGALIVPEDTPVDEDWKQVKE